MPARAKPHPSPPWGGDGRNLAAAEVRHARPTRLPDKARDTRQARKASGSIAKRPRARPALGLLTAMMAVLVPTLPATAEPKAAREAFVTNQTGDSLSIVDLASGAAAPEIRIGGKPAGIAVSPDTGTATSPEAMVGLLSSSGTTEG